MWVRGGGGSGGPCGVWDPVGDLESNGGSLGPTQSWFTEGLRVLKSPPGSGSVKPRLPSCPGPPPPRLPPALRWDPPGGQSGAGVSGAL